eukprot:11819393-Ditylum_brightwellii.AAC.2
MTESNVANMGETGIVVGTSKRVTIASVATKSNVAKVGEMGVVVATSKNVVATSIEFLSFVLNMVEIGAMCIVAAMSIMTENNVANMGKWE